MNQSIWHEKWQMIKFNVVGLLNTAIDVLLFAWLTWLGVALWLAQPIGYLAGLLNSYIWNKRWTFSVASSKGHQDKLRFLLVNVLTFGINSAVLWFGFELMGWHEWLAKGVATIVTLAANYVGYSRWVFKE